MVSSQCWLIENLRTIGLVLPIVFARRNERIELLNLLLKINYEIILIGIEQK